MGRRGEIPPSQKEDTCEDFTRGDPTGVNTPGEAWSSLTFSDIHIQKHSAGMERGGRKGGGCGAAGSPSVRVCVPSCGQGRGEGERKGGSEGGG